jgi:hypothetical protein
MRARHARLRARQSRMTSMDASMRASDASMQQIVIVVRSLENCVQFRDPKN